MLNPKGCDRRWTTARLALDLGFDPDAIARWRDLPDPPQAALDHEADDLDWRSSA